MTTTHPNTDQLLEEDQQSRVRALALGSFIVEAPAGAGKTELLTQRYLRLLAVVSEPEEILAITFTNKAAAEMRNRILSSLERALSGVAPAEPHKRITFDLAQDALRVAAERGWQLIEQPARLRILTIDSLCASLARQMPFLSRFGAQPRISDDAARHYDEAARRTIALLDESGVPEVLAETLAEALRYFDNDAQRLAGMLASMLARRDQWLSHNLAQGLREEAEYGLQALVQRDLEAVAQLLTPRLQSELMPVARYAVYNLMVAEVPDMPLLALLDWATPLSPTPDALPQWRGLAELLLTKEGGLRKQLTKNLGLPPGKESEPHKKCLMAVLAALRPQDAEVIARIRLLPDPFYTDAEWRTVEVMAQLLKLAAAQLWTVFNEQGEADFVEVAQRALQALGAEDAPSDLALQLDYRIQHLLVDEFQDTSPTQVQLLQRLTAGWQEGDGRTLFTVGDPMQSVYRFRKADVGLFLRAAETGIGNLPLQRLRLCRNNRSVAAVVDWVNQHFDGIFPAQDSVTAGAIRYRPFVASRPELPAAGVVVHPIVVKQDLTSELADQCEAARILDIITEERAAERASLQAGQPPRSIAVLVRARSHLTALVARIRSQQPQLHFQAVEIEGLAARQPVQDLLSLTRALHQRADRVHWLAILRAPWCGLCLADLHALAADNQAATLWQLMNDEARMLRLSADGQLRLGHLRTVFAEAFAHQGRSSLRRWVEGVWLQLGGAACLHKPEEAADIVDVQAFFSLLDQLDAAGRFSLDRLAEEVADLYAAPDALADGSLQFMTIHKSKGLEFDTVILPGLHHKGRPDDHALMLWEEVVLDGLSEQLVAAPLSRRGSKEDGAGSALPTPYDYLRHLEQQRSANELTRVLYVAVTRAIRRLHLVGVAKLNSKGVVARPGNSFLDLLWPCVEVEFSEEAALLAEDEALDDEDATNAPATLFIPPLVRVVEPFTQALPSPPSSAIELALERRTKQESETSEKSADEGNTNVAATAHRFAANVGVLLHAYLELIAGRDLQAWDAARIAQLTPAMLLWFTQRGFSSSEAQEGASRVSAALQTTLASQAGRWVLATHQDDAAELALTDVEDKAGAGGEEGRRKLTTHVVDRSFIADGQRWIIDYKTAQLNGATDEPADPAALRAHAETYRPQLERYARLFATEQLPQRLAIFYATYGLLVELAG